MSSTLTSYMTPTGAPIVYTAGFQQVVEDHLSYLRQHPTTEVIAIDAQVAYKNTGDLVGVLQEYNVPLWLHWIVMRMNDYAAPTEYHHDDLQLLMPSRDTLNRILKRHRVTQTMAG